MLSSQTIFSAVRAQAKPATRASLSAARTYATQPTPRGPDPARPSSTTVPPPTPSNGSNNTILYTVLGLAGAGGAYLYFKNPEDVQDMKDRAKREADELKKKGKDGVEHAREGLQRGEQKYEDLKAEGKDKIASARTTAEQDLRDSQIRGRSLPEDLEAKYETAKDVTKDKLDSVRKSTEELYKEARDAAERKTSEARNVIDSRTQEARETVERRANEARSAADREWNKGKSEAQHARDVADRKAEEAKAGWFSWLGWGKSKVHEGAERVENDTIKAKVDAQEEADRLKRQSAGKVADLAEGVRQRAEKHA